MKRCWLGLAGILIGMCVSVLMQTFMATSLPIIAREFGSMHLYSWVFAAYMLASTVTIPLFGKLADLIGKRFIYIFGIFFFLIGIFIASFSNSMQMLVACRILMGLGAGAIVPAALASIGDLFSEKEMPRIFGAVGITQVVSNIIGPLLGGLITDNLSWRWGFILFLPLGVLSGILVRLGLPSANVNQKETYLNKLILIKKLDWVGSLLISLGICSLVLGLQNIGSSNYILGFGLFLFSLVILGISIIIEKKCPDPVLPMSLLGRSNLLIIVSGALILGVVSNAAVVYIPLYIQNFNGTSASSTGALMLPMMIAAGLGSGVAGRIPGNKLRIVTRTVWFFIGLASISLAAFGDLGGENFIAFCAIPIGIGIGILLPVFLSDAQNTADASNRASIGGLIQLSRNLGGALGVPMLGIWISRGQNLTFGLKSIFVSLCVIACLGLLTAFVKKREHVDTQVKVCEEGEFKF